MRQWLSSRAAIPHTLLWSLLFELQDRMKIFFDMGVIFGYHGGSGCFCARINVQDSRKPRFERELLPMEMQTRLLTEMKEAMKSGDGDRVSVIRLLRSAIKNKEIEKRPGIVKGQEQSLTEAEVLQVIASAVKQRKESIEIFLKENRSDLVDKEKKELAILESYLPKALSEEELNQIIKDAILKSGATTMKQMGDVMKLLMPKIMGKADGKQVSEMVRASLAH